MKIKYVSHACLYVETNGDRILMDPWFGSPSYLNQWHVYPQPADESVPVPPSQVAHITREPSPAILITPPY